MAIHRKRGELARRTAERIRTAREARGLSVEALGERAGINKSGQSEIELGKRSITLDYLERVAVALGLTPQELMEGPDLTRLAPELPDDALPVLQAIKRRDMVALLAAVSELAAKWQRG